MSDLLFQGWFWGASYCVVLLLACAFVAVLESTDEECDQ